MELKLIVFRTDIQYLVLYKKMTLKRTSLIAKLGKIKFISNMSHELRHL